MNLDDYDSAKRVKVMVYGPPKSGKTALLAALAEAGFTLWWFDMENGIKTLLNPAVLKPEFRKNVRVFNIPDHRGLPIAVDVMRQLFKGGKKKFCYLHGTHMCPLCSKEPGALWSDEIDLATFTEKDILVIDSWTQVADSAGNKVTLKDWQKDPDYKWQFDDYMAQGQYQTELLTKIQVSNVNIAVISHETDIEKAETKEKLVPNGGTRNYSKKMGKYFDEIIYLKVENKKHSVFSSTTYSNTVLTGGRSGVRLEEGSDVSIVDVFKGKAA